MTKTMLIAAHELTARGTPPKGSKIPTIEKIAAGDEVDSAAMKRLGLSDDDVAALKERGTIVEVPVRSGGSSGADDAKLKAAEKRADEAEAAHAAAAKQAIGTLNDDDLRAILEKRAAAVPEKADHDALVALVIG